ncbi:MAG: sensor histidine kinase [Patescibacteria group bacterium]
MKSGISFTRRTATPFALAAVVLLVGNLLWLIPVARNIRNQVSLLQLEIADRVATDIRNYFSAAVRDLELSADGIIFGSEKREVILAKLLKYNKGIDAVFLIDGTGTEILRQDRLRKSRALAGTDYAASPLFVQTIAGTPRFGDIFISEQLEPHAVLAVPVKATDGPMVLMAEMNLRDLIPLVADVSIEDGLVYVLDRRGVQVLHPELSEILRSVNYSGRVIARRVLGQGVIVNGLSGDDSYVNKDGVKVFAVGRPVGIGNLGVFVEQPRSGALGTERQMAIVAVLIFILGIGVVSVILRAQGRLRSMLYELDEIGKILVRRDLELTRANTQLMELDAVKSEFVSIAAHQLRTPLTGIKWSLNALRTNEVEPLAPGQAQIVEGAYEGTNRMVGLIGDLLNVARMEEKRFVFEFRVAPLQPVLDEAIARYRDIGTKKRLTVLAEIADPLPMVSYDSEKLKMAIDNILSNAVNYTPAGGTITLRASRDKDHVAISVQDTGIGIPKAQQHRVFSKFFRAGNAQLRNTSGTGLGLYLSEQIIARHGGAMKFLSEEGKGSIFTIQLPVAGAGEKK